MADATTASKKVLRSAPCTPKDLSLLRRWSLAQRVKVQPEVVSYPGQVVTLQCHFTDPGQTQLTQVSWSFETATGARHNIAVFNPQFGVNYSESLLKGRLSFMSDPPRLENAAIQITDIKMTDQGRYNCEFTTFPSGSEQSVTNLVILECGYNVGRAKQSSLLPPSFILSSLRAC
ncbi:nectin-2-like [Colossoma macropomum]|uniref:nectin-2-like n=1 Tax=Colossoma macropomum TaxID=42526 RepID=UPI0018641698|nr:nectin-2-like [Colossoma macropomum]